MFDRLTMESIFVPLDFERLDAMSVCMSIIGSGKVLLTGEETKPPYKCWMKIIDCGLDHPQIPRKLYLFNFLRLKSMERDIKLNDICKIIMSFLCK
jgi:hypothetical protein